MSDLRITAIGVDSGGRPEKPEQSGRAIYRAVELVPIIERGVIDVLIEPHPDDFVDDKFACCIQSRPPTRWIALPPNGFGTSPTCQTGRCTCTARRREVKRAGRELDRRGSVR